MMGTGLTPSPDDAYAAGEGSPRQPDGQDDTGYFSQDLLPIYDSPKEGSLPSESPAGGGASHTQTGGG